MKKLIIGITGGIGSGKSTVAQYYKAQSLVVLDADVIAKQVMVENNDVVRKLKQTFGNDSYSKKELNTKFIASQVFGNEGKLGKLNSIVHPPTIVQIKKQATSLSSKSNLVFVEAAILFEANWQDNFDYIILVTSDEDLRISRVSKRDKTSEEKIRNRIQHQLDDKDKKGRADFTIENNGTLEELKVKAGFILSLIKNITKN
ncbi:MAG: dephospho-CoA kinase [Melioribacteraceae bacterium]